MRSQRVGDVGKDQVMSLVDILCVDSACFRGLRAGGALRDGTGDAFPYSNPRQRQRNDCENGLGVSIDHLVPLPVLLVLATPHH